MYITAFGVLCISSHFISLVSSLTVSKKSSIALASVTLIYLEFSKGPMSILAFCDIFCLPKFMIICKGIFSSASIQIYSHFKIVQPSQLTCLPYYSSVN
jgi:hypothetical protein